VVPVVRLRRLHARELRPVTRLLMQVDFRDVEIDDLVAFSISQPSDSPTTLLSAPRVPPGVTPVPVGRTPHHAQA
jgi:hypothetical protein